MRKCAHTAVALTDAAGENQRIQPIEHRGVGSDVYFNQITEQLDRFGDTTGSRMSKLVDDTPSSPDW